VAITDKHGLLGWHRLSVVVTMDLLEPCQISVKLDVGASATVTVDASRVTLITDRAG
jgi:hypothetical protein